MGTDIHLELERLGEDGYWHWISHPERPCDDPYCSGGLYNEKTPNEAMHGKPHYRCQGTGRTVEQFWDDRNYDVFAILADVRNGYGFAGCDTGDGFVPISEPRGLPDDLGPEIRAALERERAWDEEDEEDDQDSDEEDEGNAAASFGSYWDDPQRIDLGEHSFSWLTVEEILDYDWARTTRKRGFVDPDEFLAYERDGRPSSWCGGISGSAVRHVSNDEMRQLIADGVVPVEASVAVTTTISYYTQIEWEIPYTDVAERFLRVLQRDILPLGDPDKLRLVFGFDS